MCTLICCDILLFSYIISSTVIFLEVMYEIMILLEYGCRMVKFQELCKLNDQFIEVKTLTLVSQKSLAVKGSIFTTILFVLQSDMLKKLLDS